jgi:hypothetical protein
VNRLKSSTQRKRKAKMKIEIELITDTALLEIGYTHEYAVIDNSGTCTRNGLVKGMTGEKLAALFAGERITRDT